MPPSVYGRRPICEHYKFIDVRRWHRDGSLAAGQRFTTSWSQGDKPVGSISVRTEADAVVLMFRWRSRTDSEWKPVDQRISITWTHCHLGGQRPWFICPSCERSAALLYSVAGLFICRQCNGLAYRSQRALPRHRSMSRARKIRLKLGGSASVDDEFPERPKGMHRKTYNRLRRSYERFDGEFSSGCDRVIDRLNRSLKR
jgi:hypothetical protein